MISSILEKLENTNSQNEKIKILETLNDSQKEWFRMCYNPRITFGIKKIPSIPENPNKDLNIDQVMDLYSGLFASRVLTGNAAIEKLQEILSRAIELEPAIRLIQRDARCGVNVSLLNKVFPNLIPEIPCMLAQPMNEKTLSNIKFPAISQLKADGMRCITFITANDVQMFSRNGTEIICDPLKNSLMKIANIPNIFTQNETLMLDGELICYKDGELLDRKTSNGICNKVLKGTASQEELEMVQLQLWDFVRVDSTTLKPLWDVEYETRLDELYDVITFSPLSKLEVISTEVVNNMEEAMNHFQRMLDCGLEGTILKNKDSFFENKRSKNLVKLKEEKTIDLEVVDVEEGSGDFENALGALVCRSRDGKISVNVGTGLSMEQRGITFDLSSGKKVVKHLRSFDEVKKDFLGKIVEVKYNDIIKSKGKEEISLFLPRFIKIRDDKDQANSIEEI